MSMDADKGMCPDILELNALLDGGETAPGVAEHVAACEKCSAKLAVYRRFDQALQRHMAPPADLGERIRAAVEQAATENSATTSWWMSPAFRLAAAFVVTVGALTLLAAALGRNHPLDKGPSVAAAPTQAPGQRPASLANGRDSAPAASVPRSFPLPASSPVSDNVLARVSLDSGKMPMNHGMARPASIPPFVRHVWSVADVDNSVKYLKKVLPPDHYSYGVEDGNVFFQVTMPDDQVQGLVDNLARNKWHLVTSDAPQPEKPALFTHQPVRYRLVLAGRDD